MFGVPRVDAGEVDMLPAQRRDMLEQMVRNRPMCVAQMGDGPFDIDRVPVYDCADDEIETGRAERLASNDRSRISPRS